MFNGNLGPEYSLTDIGAISINDYRVLHGHTLPCNSIDCDHIRSSNLPISPIPPILLIASELHTKLEKYECPKSNLQGNKKKRK